MKSMAQLVLIGVTCGGCAILGSAVQAPDGHGAQQPARGARFGMADRGMRADQARREAERALYMYGKFEVTLPQVAESDSSAVGDE